MRRRIMMLVVTMTTLVVLAFAIPLALLVRHTVYEDAIAKLQDESNQIANYLRASYSPPTEAETADFLKTLSPKRSASVELADGTVIGTPPPGDLSTLPSFGDGGPGGGPDDHDHGHPQQPGVTPWEGGLVAQLPVIAAPGATGQAIVRVYASKAQLFQGENGWWLLLAGVSLALLLLGLTAAEVVTRRMVRPLTDTAETAARISAGDLTARAPTDGPREIAAVGTSLNRLADRIDELIAEEREMVADVSHRLRTPLTALRLDAEALHDPEEAERIGGHVSSLERMLTAVIHTARRPQREGRAPGCDATAVVGERVEFWSALADDQGRAVTLALPSVPVLVRASAEDLAAATDALLENVIAHTPEGVAFAVTLAPTESGARLDVADDGPGLPPDASVRGRSDRGSTGLGLDIARRCAQAAGGTMTLGASPSGGALVTLTLNAPG
jgi:signal transduction histidine kinase